VCAAPESEVHGKPSHRAEQEAAAGQRDEEWPLFDGNSGSAILSGTTNLGKATIKFSEIKIIEPVH
jgi:hypothetical protein